MLISQVIGHGPALVLVHGAMQDASSQRELATLLADRFTVHLVDRGGETDSVTALLEVLADTGARRVLGVSSGAIIAARAALAGAELDRLALFEPPLAIDGSMRLDLLPRFDAAVASGRLADVAAIGMKVAEMGPAWMFGLPVPILAAASRRMLRDARRRSLVEALPADVALVRDNADRIADFAGITAPTLVLSGTATRPYLQQAADALARVIPGARHAKLDGQWHSATQNADEYGHPELVAPVLAEFLA